MDNRIAELTKTLYEEGVEKAKEESKKIIQNAEKKAEEIIAHAKQESERIIKEAKDRAEEIKKNTEAEIQLSCRQAMAGLKQSISTVILTKSIDKPVRSVLSDPSILKDIIVQTIKNWNASGLSAGVEILLPQDLKKQIDESFTAAIKDSIGKGIRINFADSFKAGFQIIPEGTSFKISMTDEDFAEFFKSYLRPKTREILFGNT